MNTLSLIGNWNIARGRVKQKLARLADDDLQFAEGKEEELTGRIQKRVARHHGRFGNQGCGCKTTE